MKKLLYALSGLGLISLFVLGTLNERRPLSGTWRSSPFLPSTTAPGTPEPIPPAAAGTLDWEQSRQNVAMTEERSGRDRQFVETFKNPPEVSSAGGVLNLTFTAEPKEVEIAGQRVQARSITVSISLPPYGSILGIP